MTQRTAQNTHTQLHYYKSMIIHTFKQRNHLISLHLTPLLCTSLHFTPHYSLPSTFGRFVTTLQNPFTSSHI